MMQKTLFMALFLSACGSSGKPQPIHLARGGDATGAVANNGQTTTINSGPGNASDSVLDLIAPSGSSLRYVDAIGLQAYYKHVFTPAETGFAQCTGAAPWNGEDCTKSIFTATERASLGTFEMTSPEFRRGAQNTTPVANLSMDYLRTLRLALGRECTLLVKSEYSKLKAGNVNANRLIRAASATAPDLDRFMRTLLGVSGTTFTIDFGADTYVSAFAAAVNGAANADDAAQNAYTALCVSIAMDPLVILY